MKRKLQSKLSISGTLLISLILASVLLPTLDAQTAPPKTPPKSVDDIKTDSWNSLPLHGVDYQRGEVSACPEARPFREFGTPQAIAGTVRLPGFKSTA